MARQCGAQTRSRGLCHRPAKAGSARCWLHGATAGRPRGTPEHPNSRAALLEGRRRWVERMRALKARGEIERFPGGRRARGLPRLSKNPIIRKAQRIVEKAKAMVDQAIATVPERPWSELSHPEKLALETGVSLDIIAKSSTTARRYSSGTGLRAQTLSWRRSCVTRHSRSSPIKSASILQSWRQASRRRPG